MSVEQAPRLIEEPKSKKRQGSEMPSFENTQVFFSGLSFPIDGKNPPKPFGIQSEREARDWEILGRHLGTDAVLDETGVKYEILRERIRQIVEELVKQSYDAAPEALKEAFPRESLDTKKPWSLHKSIRKSEAHGGKMREVVEAVLAGKSNSEIKKETKASDAMLSMYRAKGIAVPYLSVTREIEYQDNLRFLGGGLLDDRQIITIFEDIEKHNRFSVCFTLRRAGILVPLNKAARNVEVFIHKSESMAYRLLRDLETPVVYVERQFTDKNGKQQVRKSFFVLNNHERTIGAFAHPSFNAFRTNPVEVLGRVSEEIPTTSIMWDPAYISVGKLLKERGILIRANRVRKYLEPDCEVSVFYIRSKDRCRELRVRKEDSDALVDHLKAKLAS